MTELDTHYPQRFGPFVLVTPLMESGGVALCPALRLRNARAQACLVTRLRPGGKHAAALEARFRRASETARRLRHPSIATTLAVGRLDEHLFITHEFLEGAHLSRVPPSAIDVGTAVFLAQEATAALRYLHGFEGRGLVHHGVTPTNVHLGWDGRVKVLECGLAIADFNHSNELAPFFRGGARYVAPEIRNHTAADARSDVFSIGVLLWELLAQRNWMGDDVLSRGECAPTLRADEATDRVAATAAPRVPALLYALVAKAMSPDPARRFRDAAELYAALAPFSPGRLRGRMELRRLLRRVFDMDDSRTRLQQSLSAAEPLLTAADTDFTGNVHLSPGPAGRAGTKTWALPLAGLTAIAATALTVESLRPASRPTGGAPLVAAERAAPAARVEAATSVSSTPLEPLLPPLRAPQPPPLLPPLHGDMSNDGAAAAGVGVSERRRRSGASPGASRGAASVASPRPTAPAPRGANEMSARAHEALASAESRFHWGDLDGAETLARVAVRNLAGSPRAFYLLGVVLLAKGDASKAKDAFERTLALDPTYVDADAKLRLAIERASLSQQH